MFDLPSQSPSWAEVGLATNVKGQVGAAIPRVPRGPGLHLVRSSSSHQGLLAFAVFLLSADVRTDAYELPRGLQLVAAV